MVLFQMHGKVPEVRDRLISLVIKGKKASGFVLSSLVGMVSDRQVVGFALDSSHLSSLRVTGLKDDILGRSFRKVIATPRWSSGLKDLCMISILSQKKHAKSSASDASDSGGIGFPPGSYVRESSSPNISFGHHEYPLQLHSNIGILLY